MKDVQATLRRIDEEITGHNQQIARSRVEIGRLQETRLVLMGIAEDDIATAQAHREAGHRVINGEHARPVLIVRKAGSDEPFRGDEDGSASRAAKEGLPVNSAGNRRGMGKKPAGQKRRGEPQRGMFRRMVLEVLADATEPMSGRELGNYFGLPLDEKVRKPLLNALYNMRVAGQLHRDADYRFSLPRLQPNGAGQ